MTSVAHETLIATVKKLRKLLNAAGIEYYLIGGSAIGAVRDQGMIPWDDDIDIGIRRDQIPQFVAAFNGHNDNPDIRLVKPGDTGYYLVTYKVLNTSAAVADQVDIGTGLHGVFIDVFALDKTFKTKLLRRVHQTLVRIDEVALDVASGNMDTGRKMGFLHKVAEFMAKHNSKAQLAKRYIKHVKMCNWLPSGFMYYNFGSPYVWDRETYLRDEVNGVSLQMFEGVKFPVPVGYDAILRRTYGDYMQPPAENDRAQRHLGPTE